MKILFLLIILTQISFVGNDNIHRRIISDNDFNYTFFIHSKDVKSKKLSKNYYWYKSNEIHVSQGFSSGQLLHGAYTKSFKNNNLAENGNFKNGLKNKLWKEWYMNGILKKTVQWKNGLRNGVYLEYSNQGKLIMQGRYKKGRKEGLWLNNKIMDTLYFKNGVQTKMPKLIQRPIKKRINKMFQKIFIKKVKDTL